MCAYIRKPQIEPHRFTSIQPDFETFNIILTPAKQHLTTLTRQLNLAKGALAERRQSQVKTAQSIFDQYKDVPHSRLDEYTQSMTIGNVIKSNYAYVDFNVRHSILDYALFNITKRLPDEASYWEDSKPTKGYLASSD